MDIFSNHAETTPEHTDIRLRDRRYETGIHEVLHAVREAARSLRRWTFVRFASTEGRIDLEHRTPVVPFVDDVTLHLHERNGMTIVHGSSTSRVGDWDLGQNARNLRELLRELDRRLRRR